MATFSKAKAKEQKISKLPFGKNFGKHPKVLAMSTGQHSYLYARKWPRKWRGNCWKIMNVVDGKKVRVAYVSILPTYENIWDLLEKYGYDT